MKILFLSPIWGILTATPKFGAVWGRPQQIASGLARDGHVILYVQGPIYLHLKTLPLILNSGNLFLRKKMTAHITVVNVFLPPFQGRLRFVLNRLRVPLLNLYLKFFGFNPDVAIFYDTQYNFLLDTLKSMDTKIIYDCVDEVSGFPGLPDVAATLKEERELVSNSSIVIATSELLCLKLSKINPNCFYIPNGADVSHFVKNAKTGEKIPELELLRHPIIGYIGAISEWFDAELVCKLADLHPEYSILLIGPVTYGPERFEQHPNITLLGAKKYEVIPQYLSYMDVCLVPFKINKLTLAINPVKLYEYLVAGKPVVSTALPEICNNASDLVYIGKDCEDFIKKVEIAVNEAQDKAVISRRIAYSRENSWEKRVEKIEKLLKSI